MFSKRNTLHKSNADSLKQPFDRATLPFLKMSHDLNAHDTSSVGGMSTQYDPEYCKNDESKDVMQQYFAAMLLDTDRNNQYWKAIVKAVQAFKVNEGRDPVVLDVGCGTGFLTACAVFAGAEKVVCVDLSEAHVNNLSGLIKNSQTSLFNEERVIPVLVSFNVKTCEKKTIRDKSGGSVDMIVSEILGTFCNSEGATKILDNYIPLLKRHKSGNVYVVPSYVKQTIRKFEPPSEVRKHMEKHITNKNEYKFMPTNEVGWLFQLYKPIYSTEEIIEREDDFLNFTTRQERRGLEEGFYLVEWKATLYDDVVLENTWKWAYDWQQRIPRDENYPFKSNVDIHSHHARGKAWGLMCFHAQNDVLVNDLKNRHVNLANVSRDSNMYDVMYDEEGQEGEEGEEGEDDEPYRDGLRLYNPPMSSYELKLKAQNQLVEMLRTDVYVQGDNKYYVRFDAVRLDTVMSYDNTTCTLTKVQFDDQILYETTLGALFKVFKDPKKYYEPWYMSLENEFYVLPYLLRKETTNSEYDRPVHWIGPSNYIPADANSFDNVLVSSSLINVGTQAGAD